VSARRRELGRGERVLPGLWRLRLPLPWPGVPHCNAWAVAAGDGIVLFDTGMHEPGSLAHLERALAQVNLSLDNVRLLVCTHAHSDHYGQAADIVDRAGCELWMHPNHEHMTRAAQDPDAALSLALAVDEPTVLAELNERLSRAPDAAWVAEWREADEAATRAIERALGDELSEPWVARELGRRLAVPVELVVYDAAGKVADAARTGAWDVAFLAIDPARATEGRS